jgi:ribosomal protein L37AE/L43A
MTTFTIGDQITLKDGREMTVTDLKHDDADQLAKVQTRYEKDNGKNQTNWHNANTLRERVAAVLQVMETQYQPCPECGAVDVFRVSVLPDGAISNARCLECKHTVIGGKFTPPAEPPPLKGSDQSGIEQPPLKGSPPDLFSLPAQPGASGDLSDVITPRPAPPPRRKMTPDEKRNAFYYLTATTSMNHNHARSLVEYFGHNVGDALTAGEGLDAAPGIGHVTGPTAASAWNRAPSWVRECLPLGIEGYPPTYIEYVIVHRLGTPNNFRDKFPLPNDEQPFAHLVALAGPDLQQLATYIHAIATFIEGEGNKGYEQHELEIRMDKLGHDDSGMYLLHRVYEDLWRGILFRADGSGNSDYSGWGVRKKPHWLGMWMDRFKHHAPTLYQDELDTLHDQALKENAIPPRPHGRDPIGYSTRKLAYHAACTSILIDRYTRCTMFRRQSDDDMKLAVYRARLRLTRRELAYRARYIPTAGDDHYDPRLSLADAIQDYEDANRYIDRGHSLEDDRYIGRDQFFTDQYVEQVLCSAAEPDLHIDLDAPSTYPRGTLAQTPAQQLTPKQLLVTITRLLLTKTEDDFTEEDKQNFLSLAANLLPDAGAYTDGDAWQRLRARLDKLNLNRS